MTLIAQRPSIKRQIFRREQYLHHDNDDRNAAEIEKRQKGKERQEGEKAQEGVYNRERRFFV